jgi:transglutaminase superfamily protein
MAVQDPRPLVRQTARRTVADLRAFARAWGLLLAADLGLRFFSFARVERWLDPPLSRARDVADGEDEAVGRLVWSVAAAARHHLYPMRCVPRALTLRWLLGRHGIPVQLKIGVIREAGTLAAHAWVERDGRAIGEPAGIEERFSPLGAG